MNGHQFPDGIDPYIVRGDSASDCCTASIPIRSCPTGRGTKKCRPIISASRLPIVRRTGLKSPARDNYDPQRYELLVRLKEKLPWKTPYDVFIWSRMPNGKTDINNSGGFSTDVIGENWNYPEADYPERERIRKFHEDYTKGLLYFIGHDPRVPDSIRREMLRWGYPKDEYTDNGHWTHQMYVREARRMIGPVVMTQHHCLGEETVTDGIGWAAYTMDSHNCDRHVVNGMVKNEGNVEIGGVRPLPRFVPGRYAAGRRSPEPTGSGMPVRIAHRLRFDPHGAGIHGVGAVVGHSGLSGDRPVRRLRAACRRCGRDG